jgi:hypothetical protein
MHEVQRSCGGLSLSNLFLFLLVLVELFDCWIGNLELVKVGELLL